MSQLYDYRISDAERQQATDALSSHFAAGRLNVTEYDNRLAAVADAKLKSEITYLFTDLPTATPPMMVQQPFNTNAILAYKQDQNRKIGMVLLAFLGAGLLNELFSTLGNVMGIMALVLLVALFVMKLGPKSWKQPNPLKLQHQINRI